MWTMIQYQNKFTYGQEARQNIVMFTQTWEPVANLQSTHFNEKIEVMNYDM
jgi:hypothetical protein